MPRPKQDKYCVCCKSLILNPENIKKKGYACEACKRDGLVYFCGKCGYQETPQGTTAAAARCSRCRPPIHTLEYRDGEKDFNSPQLKDVFITAFTDTYSPFPHGEPDLGAFLTEAFEETKAEVLAGQALSIVALSPTSTLNKYVGVITARLDHPNKAVYISQAAVIKRCWGLGVLKSLSTNLLANLSKRLEFERLYFITRRFNEKVAKIAMERFFFTQSLDASLFPPNYDREKYVSFVCQGNDLARLRDKLRIKAEKKKNSTTGTATTTPRPKKRRPSSITEDDSSSSPPRIVQLPKRPRYAGGEDPEAEGEEEDEVEEEPQFCEFDFGRDSDSESAESSPLLPSTPDTRNSSVAVKIRGSMGSSSHTSSSASSPWMPQEKLNPAPPQLPFFIANGTHPQQAHVQAHQPAQPLSVMTPLDHFSTFETYPTDPVTASSLAGFTNPYVSSLYLPRPHLPPQIGGAPRLQTGSAYSLPYPMSRPTYDLGFSQPQRFVDGGYLNMPYPPQGLNDPMAQASYVYPEEANDYLGYVPPADESEWLGQNRLSAGY